jgi:hypothetical protein
LVFVTKYRHAVVAGRHLVRLEEYIEQQNQPG